MIIRRLRARRFRRLDDVIMDFDPGLNIIKGPNEAGKSTVHAALLKVLFERPTLKKANEDDRAWYAEQLYELTLEFTDSAGVKWILRKDFESNATNLTGAAYVTSTYQAAQDKVGSIIGTSSDKVFISTVCVKQDAIVQIADGSKEIAGSLEEIVTGGEEDVYSQAAINKLDEAVREYKRGHITSALRNLGPIALLKQHEIVLQSEVARLAPVVEQRSSAAVRLQEISARLGEITEKLTQNKNSMERFLRAQDFQKALGQSRTEEDKVERQLEQIQSAVSEESTAQRALSLDLVAALSEEEISEIGRLKSRVDILTEQQLREGISASPSSTISLGSKDRSASRWEVIVFLYLLGVFGLGTAGVLYFQYRDLSLTSVISATIGLGSLLAAIVLHAKAGRGASIAGSSAVAAPETSVASTDLIIVQDALVARLNGVGCQSWQDFSQRQQTIQKLKTQQSRAEAQVVALISATSTKEGLEQQRKDASRKRRDIEERLTEPKLQLALSMTLAEFNQLEQETEKLEEELATLKNESGQLQYKLSVDINAEVELLRVQDELTATSARLERALEKLTIYELALKHLSFAREQTLVRASDLLAPKLGGYLAGLTNGRYATVSVDANLNITVHSKFAPNGKIDPRSLSRGTQDQVYLAARLALVDLLFPDTCPPILLDDPFVTFDTDRRSAALRLCQRIGEKRQVFLFTHANDCDHLGKVIDLQIQLQHQN